VACDYEGGESGSDAELKAAFADPFYPRFWEERLEKIRKLKKPTGIFLDDMSDWMGEYWPKEWTEMELQVMRDCPQHRFYTLTKQPQNLPGFSPLPENCWVGVTATNTDMAVSGLTSLSEIEAKVKYISFEPLLSWIPLTANALSDIHLVIIGACTGSWDEMANLCMKHTNSLCNYQGLKLEQWGKKWTAQPRIEWLREIVGAADKAGIKVFLKDNLRPLLIPEDCSKPNYLTEDIFWASEKAQLRQEMPL